MSSQDLFSLVKILEKIFFEKKNLAVLGIFRIALGLLVLANLFLIFPHFLDFFGPEGLMSQETARVLAPGFRPSLFYWIEPSEPRLWAVFWALVLSSFFMVLGLFSRISVFMTYFLVNTLHHQNLAALYGFDTVLRVFLFWMLLAPSGRYLSLDNIIRHLRGRSLETGGEQEVWSLRILQMQLLWIYFETTFLKLGGSMWIDGTAVYYTFRLDDFSRFPLPELFLNSWVIRLITWGTLLIEFALAVLLPFKEFRRVILFFGFFFHFGLDLFMNVPLFQWIMISGLLLFVPQEDFQKVLFVFQKKLATFRGTLFFDGDCAFCTRVQRALSHLDLFCLVEWKDFRQYQKQVSRENWLRAFDPERAEKEVLWISAKKSKVAGGFFAFRIILWRLPLFWIFLPVFYFPGISALGVRVYSWVAKNRRAFVKDSQCPL